jgi:hypothetical protein
MVNLEKRLQRTFSRMAAEESLAEGLDKESATSMLRWSEVIAKQFVLKTSQMEDNEAYEFLAPYAGALHKMMRAIGYCAVETDEEVRSEWWNRIEQNGKTLYGDGFVLPKMEKALSELPPNANTHLVITFIQRLVETQRARG